MRKPVQPHDQESDKRTQIQRPAKALPESSRFLDAKAKQGSGQTDRHTGNRGNEGPFQKIADILEFQQPVTSYFSTDIIKGEMAHARFYPEEIRRQIPLCEYRKYTISEIINAVIESGFTLKCFDEHPAWTDPGLPGEFTVIAIKE